MCSLLVVVPPSPLGLGDPPGTRSHQKPMLFVAKLTWAKQMNSSFRYTRACLGKRTHRDGQAASDGSDDEGPLKHASKELRGMRSAPRLGAAAGAGAHVASSPSSFLQCGFAAWTGRHELEVHESFTGGWGRNALPEVSGS